MGSGRCLPPRRGCRADQTCHRRCSETHPALALSQPVATTALNRAASSRETEHKHGPRRDLQIQRRRLHCGLPAVLQERPGQRRAVRGQQREQACRNPPQPHTHLHDDSLTPRVAAGEHQHHLPRLHKLAHLCRHSTRRSRVGSGRSQHSRSPRMEADPAASPTHRHSRSNGAAAEKETPPVPPTLHPAP